MSNPKLLVTVSFCATFLIVGAIQRGANAQEVYELDTSAIQDDELEHFYVSPAVDPPNSSYDVPEFPEEFLPEDFVMEDWVFEGFERNRTEDEVNELKAKKEKIRKFFKNLNENKLLAFQKRIEKKREKQLRKEAEDKGLFYDDRPTLAVYVFSNGQVWSRKKPQGYQENLKSGEDFEGIYSFEDEWFEDDGTDDAAGGGSGDVPYDELSLRSSYNGHNMTKYPIRAHGCISSGTNSGSCFCSGTKISARMVITAGHCLTDGKKDWNENADYFIPGVDGVGRFLGSTSDASPNGVKGWKARAVPEKWWKYQWDNYDMGVLVLKATESNCDLGWLGYANESGLLSDYLYMYGVPGGGQGCYNSPRVDQRCGNSIYYTGDWVEAIGTHRFWFDRLYGKPGMSGSGFWKYIHAKRYVVGVYTESGDWDSNLPWEGVHINNGKLSFLNDVKDQFPNYTACGGGPTCSTSYCTSLPCCSGYKCCGTTCYPNSASCP